MNKAAFLAYYGGRRRNTGFTPASLTQVVAWWSADDHGTANMTDDGAGLISEWKDRIGGLSVTGATTARPTWTSTAFNGAKAGLTFDRSANTLVGTTLTGIPATTVSGVIWTVAQVTTASPGANQTPFGYGVNSAFRKLIIVNSTGVLQANDNAAGATTAALSNGSLFIGAGAYDATSITAYLNGAAGATVTNTLNTTNTRMRIGASPNTAASEFFGGAVRHCLITTALTKLQRQQLEGWAAWDGGAPNILPSNHPYRPGAP